MADRGADAGGGGVENPGERFPSGPLTPDEDLTSGLSDSQVSDLRGPITTVLDSQRSRIEYTETRRAALGVLGGVVLAAGLAALIQLAGGDIPYPPAEAGLVAVAAGLALTGVFVLAVYGRQTNWNYPFKAVSKTWKWFYRDAIPSSQTVKPAWHTLQSGRFKSASHEAFIADRRELARRLHTLADDRVDLAQDLEQVHLLHWNDFYKNQFLTRLRAILIRGVELSLAAGVISFLIVLAF